MKAYRFISMAVPMVFALAACNNNELLPEGTTLSGNGNEIRITAAMNDFTAEDGTPETRAVIGEDGAGSFENGDEIGVWSYLIAQGKPVGLTSATTITYNSGGSLSGFTATWEDYETKWAENPGAPLIFTAIYPCRLSFPALFSVQNDQNTADGYEKSTLLLATQRLDSRPQDGAVNLDFEHKMVCLKITLLGEKATNASVTVKNIGTQCTVDVDGSVILHPSEPNPGDITPKAGATAGTFYAVVPPHTLTDDGLKLEITTADGTTVGHTVKGTQNKKLEGGKWYGITLTLTDGSGSGDPPYSIYLAGGYQNDNYDTFGYTFVNGVQTDLPAPAGGIGAQPNSMTVFGGKTYVAGDYFDSDGWARACYWIDGTVTKLDGPADRDSDQPDYVRSITVSDGKVYAAGSYMNNYNDFPCYWVDGAFNALALPSGTSSGATYAIAVSGSKVYAAGYSYDSAKIPGYWNDGVFVSLDIPAGATFTVRGGMGMGIAVSDKVYVMGNYRLNDVNYPCVWADGVRTDLTFDNSMNGGASGTSLAVSGGKVYVSGYSITNNSRPKACYWVDGTRTDLKIPADTYSDGGSIGVIDGKVYVGGRYYDSPFTSKPCYWFGDERTDLDIPTGGTQASITGMYVSK